jgi:hypothetical protein
MNLIHCIGRPGPSGIQRTFFTHGWAVSFGFELWGIRIWPYHLLNIAIHAFSTILVARLGTRWSESDRVGGWAAILFASGLGIYAKAVVVISNVTMLLGLAFLLIALDLLWSGRWKVALLFFVLGIASHEAIVVPLCSSSSSLAHDGVRTTCSGAP